MKRGHEKEFVCLRRDGSCQSVPSLVHLRSPCMSLLLGLFLLNSQDSVTQDYVHRTAQHRAAAIKSQRGRRYYHRSTRLQGYRRPRGSDGANTERQRLSSGSYMTLWTA